MKIPCELVVWYVLPTIRREVAKELVEVHKMSQAQVARMFGVTDAAISQYLKRKRGDNPLIEDSPHHDLFAEEIKAAASRMALEGSDFANEICNICTIVKKTGMLARIYEVQMGCSPPLCACERDRMIISL
ncbi:MAG: transcriptional regulator [Candidatus Methanomethylophilaceae archaeon]|jgi:predicted transcriptional regulator|nr:transcriptional regulator [Candidatus Methanomethylophilaceae archaeon]